MDADNMNFIKKINNEVDNIVCLASCDKNE